MKSSKVKALVIVSVVLLITGFVTVGCKQKTKTGWVNTNSLPGQGVNHYGKNVVTQNNSSVIYLGSDKRGPNGNFGPGEISFEFKDLR